MLPHSPSGTAVPSAVYLTMPTEDVRRRITERTNKLIEVLAAGIDAAIAAGEAKPVDPRQLATFLWRAWIGVGAFAGGGSRTLGVTPHQRVEALDLGRWLLREALLPAHVNAMPHRS
jgi:hypothetical protein